MKRIYAPRSIYDAFTDALCDRLADTTVGHGLDPRSGFGPLNNKKQYDSVSDMIEGTKNSQAKVVQLGRTVDPETWERHSPAPTRRP